jgi:N-acetylneuraminic acid mutarotase
VAAMNEDYLFVVGGWFAGECLNVVEVMNFRTLKWSTPLSRMSTPRNSCAAVCTKDMLIAIGGWNDGPSGVLSSVEMCDTKTFSWRSLPSMNFPRSGCSAAIHNDQLIVLGGDNCEVGLMFLSDGEVYSFETEKWTPFPIPMLFPRVSFGMAIEMDHIFVVGGWNGNGQVESRIDSTEVLDLNNIDKGWEQLPSVPLPSSSFSMFSGCGAVVKDGKLFACFGEQSFVYDIESQEWTEICAHSAWMSKPACFIIKMNGVK